MDDTLLFIPPCCVDRKLPKAVMQAPQRMLTFYTHGDVTMEKFYRAVSYLLVDPHVMVLAMPAVTPDTMSFLLQCFERKWITALVLSTARKNAEIVGKFLGDYQGRVLYTQSKDVTDTTSHMVLYNKERALTINGAMLDHAYSSLESYSLMFYPSHCLSSNGCDWGNPIRNILLPDVLRHRQQVRKDKRKVEHPALCRFLDCKFPPYKEDEKEDNEPKDHYSFSNI